MSTSYPVGSSQTILLGCRVRYVVEGAAHYGTIVHVDYYAGKYAEAIVAREDGSMFAERIVKLTLAEEQLPLPSPYRGDK